jgi:hypothetical protein
MYLINSFNKFFLKNPHGEKVHIHILIYNKKNLQILKSKDIM